MKKDLNSSDETLWVDPLISWFYKNKRSMPWREESTPYRRWLSEIMLQQTRVDTGIPYFLRFVERYPDIPSLAKAQEDDVLKLWEGLGYYSRARNLLKAARVMVEQHESEFPRTEKEAKALPGVGPYTTAAVLSMAYGIPLPSVDGNVLRVYARLTALGENVMEAGTVKKVQQALDTIIPRECPGDFNEAMMELGALVCLPANPACGACPVQDHCQAFATSQVEQLPIRIKKDTTTRHRYWVFYVLDSTQTKVAAKKNPPKGLLGGLWAFPMAELGTSHDSQRDRGKREKASQSEVETAGQWADYMDPFEYMGKYTHVFSHRKWFVEVFHSTTDKENLPEGFQWVPVENLKELAFPEVYQKVIRLMEERPASI